MFRKNKIEAIPFRKFMANEHTVRETPRTNSIYAFSAFFPAITPKSFFPIHDVGFALFLIGAGTIALSAFVERSLARGGLPVAAHVVAEFGRFVFPIVTYGAVLWLFFFGLRGV
jgi:hypothetical protein